MRCKTKKLIVIISKEQTRQYLIASCITLMLQMFYSDPVAAIALHLLHVSCFQIAKFEMDTNFSNT